MTPWLQDPDVVLYHGDCLQVLRELPSSSVHMCATSPPFYGLRDYGTGEWEGGQPDCDHVPDTRQGPDKQDAERRERGERRGYAPGSNFANYGSGQTAGDAVYRSTCGKCGARRVDQQIGLEETPDQWVERLVAVFREVRRVLRDDGTLWVEIGDSYQSSGGPSGGAGHQARDDNHGRWGSAELLRSDAGVKAKDLIGQPWLLAFALRQDGWWLRSEIIWARPNPMPESVTDRPTKSHSTVFLLSKQPRYFYDADAIREPPTTNPGGAAFYAKKGATMPTTADARKASAGRGDGDGSAGWANRIPEYAGANARSVWQIPTQPTPFAHFATWPESLCRRMILAGTSEKGCCPECGAPWVRDSEKLPPQNPHLRSNQPGYALPRETHLSRKHSGSPLRDAHGARRTVGWTRSCEHDWQLAINPCTVLDPFAGSATTNLVARNHGRHSIGIELNETYLKIASKRLQQLTLLA